MALFRCCLLKKRKVVRQSFPFFSIKTIKKKIRTVWVRIHLNQEAPENKNEKSGREGDGERSEMRFQVDEL